MGRIEPSGVGAISELWVAADLLSRGFHVFRSLSAHCPCDLVAFHEYTGLFLRLEVKTGPQKPDSCLNVVGNSRRYHVLASVLKDGDIRYLPNLKDPVLEPKVIKCPSCGQRCSLDFWDPPNA